MSAIRVLETHKDSPSGLRFAEREAPQPSFGEVLIQVEYISPNFGESNRANKRVTDDGVVLGWDAAGTVIATGPVAPRQQSIPVGTRVVTRGLDGGWAEQRVARIADTSIVPDSVDLAVAATLPTAGGTALGALQRGTLLGRTVLVTGASGGVGRFAVQLARLGGARVIAQVGSEASKAGLAELGADLIVTDLDDVHEGVDHVVESVGGPWLVKAFALLRQGGQLQSLGWASGVPATFDPLGTVGPTTRVIQGFLSSENDYGPLVDPLLQLIADGKLTVDINWQDSWEKYDESIQILLGRQLRGKAVWEVRS